MNKSGIWRWLKEKRSAGFSSALLLAGDRAGLDVGGERKRLAPAR